MTSLRSTGRRSSSSGRSYLYLAGAAFGAAGIPYQASDGLPLAAEPTAAAIDLVLELVASSFTRDAIVALLRSPHFSFEHDGREVSREEVSALDRALSGARYLGDLGRLEALAADMTVGEASTALSAALGVARALAPLAEADAASRQIRRVLTFVAAYARPHAAGDPFAPRERRGRSAILDMLEALATAHAAHNDVPWTIDELAAAARRWTEEQTFVSETDGAGVHLLDDQAVRYGDFDDITIVGMIENDWPDRPRLNIFYPPALLKALGWPSEKDRRGAADARFLDVLASASRRVTLSSFTLDEESIVSPSPQLDEVPRAKLSTIARAPSLDARVFVDEALMLEPLALDVLDPDARGWGAMRAGRTPADALDFHGHVGVQPSRPWSLRALETYLGCPFSSSLNTCCASRRARRRGSDGPRREGRSSTTCSRRFSTRGRPQDGVRLHPPILTRPGTCSPSSSIARSSDCRPPRPVSRARACSALRPPQGWARRSCGWKPSGPLPSSNASSNTGWRASSR